MNGQTTYSLTTWIFQELKIQSMFTQKTLMELQ